MKKVLVVSGSPRPKGNTYKVTKFILDRLEELEEVAVEYLFLKKTNLDYCRGCLKCMKKGEEFCPCKDDSLSLRDRMVGADGLVFISPVYVHTVTALMKNFFDRFAYMCHQPRLLDKPAMLVVTTELSGGKETLEYMRFPVFTWGCNVTDRVEVIYPAFEKEGKYRDKALERCDRAAQKFFMALAHPQKRPTFQKLAFFNLMKSKVTFHQEFLPRDYSFWKENEWLDKAYYCDECVPVLKSALARFMVSRKVRHMITEMGFDPALTTANGRKN